MKLENRLSAEEKILRIEESFKEIMLTLGMDLNDPSLAKTPRRVARMYVNEIFSGMDPNNFPDISLIDDDTDYVGSRLVLIKDIPFTSFCEHHFMPMTGYAHVAYIPNEKIIGLSKINRIIRYYSKRPQLQERLTVQIAECLSMILNTPDIAVLLNAKHFCVVARGIEDSESSTTTSLLRGAFESDPNLRSEFLTSLK